MKQFITVGHGLVKQESRMTARSGARRLFRRHHEAEQARRDDRQPEPDRALHDAREQEGEGRDESGTRPREYAA
jgi:hypothetical protein